MMEAMILEHKHRTRPSSGTSSLSFWLLIIGLIAITVYAYTSLRATSSVYDRTQAVLSSNKSTIRSFTIPGSESTIYLVTPELVHAGQLWGLTSKNHPLPANYEPKDIINTEVAHGDADQPMKVQKHIEAPLKAIFAAAENDGIELMLSSAYRSVADQEKLYDSFVAEQGAEMAKQYVAVPGSSEHHTGMSVDFSSASGLCEVDSDKCSLSQEAASWLHENAARFGFIQRYPEGKQPITGVAFEPWHYRYVGVALARAMQGSDLTLDEIIEQIAPGLKSGRPVLDN